VGETVLAVESGRLEHREADRRGRKGTAGRTKKKTPVSDETIPKKKVPDTTPETRWPGIHKVAPGTYVIDQSLVSDAQSQPLKYTGGARADMVEKNGRSVGFRVSGISKKSALYAAGIRNGDVLTNVNGHKLTSVDEAVLAAASLRFSDKYRVDLLRGDQKRYLYYRVAAP
jgi:general secretion pathway protein C